MFGWHISVDPNWREFKHPLFKKGHIELLPLIKRKNGTKTKSEKRERSRSGRCFLSVVSDSTDHALSMSVKKSKLDRDLYLRELSLLKKQISDMESKYNNILQENRFLWKTFMNSKKQQDIMKQQMERICKFINKFSAGNRLLETDDTPQYVCFLSSLLRRCCRTDLLAICQWIPTYRLPKMESSLPNSTTTLWSIDRSPCHS